MNINLDSNQVFVREVRLRSITGYEGTLSDLAEKASCGSLSNRERCFSQSSLCLNMCGISELLSINEVAVINHASVGCCTGFAGLSIINSQLAARLGRTYSSVLVGTDLDESDTVFGATDSIYDIARQVVAEHHPKALFVASSCVSGVIGEDIDSVVADLREEFDIPVGAMHCEGFKSRIWQSGADIADHAVLQTLVKPPKEKRPVINFKNFFESQRDQITEIFARLGVTPQFLYVNSTVEEVEHLSEALATVSICGTLGTYLGSGLEELYGVPYIRSLNPSGVTGFEDWLRTIGRTIDKEAEVEEYLAEQRELYLPQIEELKKELKGLRAVLAMGPGYSYEVTRVLQELGIETVWTLSFHLDHHYDNDQMPPAFEYLAKHSKNDFSTSIADMQNFEILHILDHFKPDLYFSRHAGTTVWAVKQGIPSVYVADEYMIFGYKGTLDFARTVLDTIRNRSFEQNLAARTTMPYTDWWYKHEKLALLEDEVQGDEAIVQESEPVALYA
jgi:nitrogenase molybdenum-iron protein alpha chain